MANRRAKATTTTTTTATTRTATDSTTIMALRAVAAEHIDGSWTTALPEEKAEARRNLKHVASRWQSGSMVHTFVTSCEDVQGGAGARTTVTIRIAVSDDLT